ncbi:uncharacterized protein EHS24_000440 [Apiotrichum porosum]|uniref:TPR domain protein n=1 Tax=Apiotrichum porosum TaxID=105984 RepID=A0A427Y9T4_9TREE|nr:uncharacterized protein EHS24_000440 [Apiotrichum porosum]RSH87920.1 hypothetical protein EHS24_000440 [Apiotrichum porosum]
MTQDITSDSLTLPPPPIDEYPYNLGSYSKTVTTSSPDAQRWFNRGLTWTYAFHHLEAVRCFKYAAACDPSCAMAYWGIAYAAGPNYNKTWENFDTEELRSALIECHLAALRAAELATAPQEKALTAALVKRFPLRRADIDTRILTADGPKCDELGQWNRVYADEMAKVYKDYPDNLDVAAVYADSLMQLAPWELWDIQTGAPRERSQTLLIKEVLERALEQSAAMSHPGVLHFYIHLMELSPWPERALQASDALLGLVPDGGHLQHMPGHIDLLVGDYRRAIAGNLLAIEADEKYVHHGTANDFYAFYRLHDYTFPIYAAMFSGQFKVAMDTVERMETSLSDEFLRIPSPPMIDWMEGFKTYRIEVLVRFGKWDDLLALPFPDDREFYCVTTTFMHYGRALALGLTGRLDEADAEQKLFREARAAIKPSRQAFPNQWQDILNVAEEMLQGELVYRKGNFEEGFAHLRKSIHYADNLVYAEPWGWLQPPRHAYAALLLEQNRVEDAAKVYAEDLGFSTSLPRAVRHPNNVWALHGYHECLVRLGRTAEASMLVPQLSVALAVADVPIESSCYCRRVKKDCNGASECAEACSKL